MSEKLIELYRRGYRYRITIEDSGCPIFTKTPNVGELMRKLYPNRKIVDVKRLQANGTLT